MSKHQWRNRPDLIGFDFCKVCLTDDEQDECVPFITPALEKEIQEAWRPADLAQK